MKFTDILNDKHRYMQVVIVISTVLLLAVSFMPISVAVQKSQKSDLVLSNDSLRMAVENSVHDYCLTSDEAEAITMLDLSSGVALKSFSDLEPFKNITNVYISNSTIDSLEGIQNFHKLDTVIIYNSVIADTRNMKNLKLSHLETVGCEISGEVDLKNMPELTYLDFSNNRINSLKGNFPRLCTLKLNNNMITNIKMIGMPHSVEELYLNGNPLESLEGLQDYDNINKLSIMNMDISDFTPLRGMNKLNALYIDKDVMDDSLEYLYSNFRNGDNARKKEYLSRMYMIED